VWQNPTLGYLVAAPDKFIDVSWATEANCLTNMITANNNVCPNDVNNGARICAEYQPEGCQTSQQWLLPEPTFFLQVDNALQKINDGLEVIGGKKFFAGEEYWTSQNNQLQANSRTIGGGAQDDNKINLKLVRPCTYVPY
jgi:hypothetical protein